jgi:ABC-type transport system involved in cytochrome c biogenesis permease subunit
MGGAGELMMTGGPSGNDGDLAGATAAGGGTADRTSAAQVFDGVTMVLMELAFVMLWAGLVMGAIWADHSWGRPWGWDPKEVFALNTFLIFAVLVHVRLKAKDKGLWTAVLAVIGAGVMLFNWIVVNFVITGLHSYA